MAKRKHKYTAKQLAAGFGGKRRMKGSKRRGKNAGKSKGKHKGVTVKHRGKILHGAAAQAVLRKRGKSTKRRGGKVKAKSLKQIKGKGKKRYGAARCQSCQIAGYKACRHGKGKNWKTPMFGPVLRRPRVAGGAPKKASSGWKWRKRTYSASKLTDRLARLRAAAAAKAALRADYTRGGGGYPMAAAAEAEARDARNAARAGAGPTTGFGFRNPFARG